MIKVTIRQGQSVEKALKIFKKKVKESGMMLELRERSFYRKPSDIKREKNNKSNLMNYYNTLKEKEKN